MYVTAEAAVSRRQTAKKNKTDYLIQTVAHALDVLEQFRENAEEIGVTELSKRLKLHKNNVFRLLATLESRNYVEQNRVTENYRLGMKNLELGQTVLRQTGLLRQARPVLEALVRECNETSYVAILRDFHTVYLDSVESDMAVRVVTRVGARFPFYCTAAGKVLAATIKTEEIRRYLNSKNLQKFTEATITDPDELMRHLSDVVEHGYAIENEEHDASVRSVSAPIRDYWKHVVGAVCVSGPVMRFSAERMNDELIPKVRDAAHEISLRLGYPSS